MGTVAWFVGGPLDGKESLVVPTDANGNPDTVFDLDECVFDVDLYTKGPAPGKLDVTRHRYRLVANVGPLVRYDYEGTVN